MNLAEYIRVLRAHLLLIVMCVVVCTTIAALLAWTRTPSYAANTQFFISTSTSNPSDIYQSGLFSQQRIQSYAQLVTSPNVLRALIKELGLRYTTTQLAGSIRATVPEDTVLIDITVTDDSPRRSQAIASSLGKHFSTFVKNLESSRGGQASTVKVSVTSPPEVPTAPVSPKKLAYLMVGMTIGLLLGVVGAVLREVYAASRYTRSAALAYAAPASKTAHRGGSTSTASSRVTAAADVSAIVNAPLLGTVSEANGQLPSFETTPSSPRAASYRLLQAKLRTVALDRGLRSFVVTSAVESEGKTAIVASLGLVLAQAGYRVILVDANFRHPTLSTLLGFSTSVGLTDVITSDVPVEEALQSWRGDSSVDGRLQVLPSGQPRRDECVIFDSRKLTTTLATLRDHTDVVIVDSPALLPSYDAVLLTGEAAGAILVARAGSTRVDQLETATESLRAAAAPIVGVVLNQPGSGRWA